MNKLGGIGGGFFAITLFLILGYILYLVLPPAIDEVRDYWKYEDFCEERPNFCYCSFGECEFKKSWSSTEGLSQDTKDLCKLAKELEDKKTIFKVGC